MRTAGRKTPIVVGLGALIIIAVAAFGPSMYSAWKKRRAGTMMATPEGQKRQLVERLLNVTEWNRWRRIDRRQTAIDLSAVDLGGVDLSISELEMIEAQRGPIEPGMLVVEIDSVPVKVIEFGADLIRVDLFDADLHDVNLEWANLFGANLRRANLRGANLKGTNLADADFSGADLAGANFTEARINGTNFAGATLCRAKFAFLNWRTWEGKSDLADIESWQTVSYKGANIFELRNPPGGFIEFALKQGAVQEPPRSE